MAMKMSAFGGVVALVALFASLQCKVHAGVVEKPIERYRYTVDGDDREARSLYPEDGFLAGESTPVWLAHIENSKAVYNKLEEGIVKKAIEYFKSDEFHGAVRYRRDANENITLVETPEEIAELYHTKREANGKEEFYYPSLLIVLEFENQWPSNKKAQEKLLLEKILYTLAYWNAVDVQLRRVRYPAVRIRIAGIVIARDKNAIPVWTKRQSGLGIRIYESLGSSIGYWDKLRNKNADFRKGAFNVIATMTDTSPLIATSYGWSLPDPNCDSSYRLGGYPVEQLSALMVYDDQSFYGLSQTVAEVAHIMGRGYTGARASVDAKSFTDDDLQAIRSHLKLKAGCWKKPYELYPPGTPVQEILPEDVFKH